MVSNMIEKNKSITKTREYANNIWDKQDWETEKEYSYFLAYLNMTKRSMDNIPGVTSVTNSDGTLNLNPLSGNYMANISVANKWQDRVNAYDINYQKEIQESTVNFRNQLVNSEKDVFYNLSAMYDKVLKKASNNPNITPKEINQLVILADKIDNFGRRIIGLPEKYSAGVLESNINNNNTTTHKIQIVEVSRPVLAANNNNIIEGEIISSSLDESALLNSGILE